MSQVKKQKAPRVRRRQRLAPRAQRNSRQQQETVRVTRANDPRVSALIKEVKSLRVASQAAPGLKYDLLTDDAKAWAEMVINPFGSGTGFTRSVRMPDADTDDTYLIQVSGRTSVPAGTATSMWLQHPGLGFTAQFGATCTDSVRGSYGVDVNDGTASQTSFFTTGCTVTQAASLSGLFGQSNMARLLASAIRVTTNDIDTASAQFQAYFPSTQLGYAAASYYTNAQIAFNMKGDSRDAKKGITLRRGVKQGYEDFKTPHYPWYGTAGVGAGLGKSAWGDIPTIKIFGISATTVLYINWVEYYQVRPLGDSPLPLGKSVYEPQFELLKASINGQAQVTDGHTFASFMKQVGRALTWIPRNRKKIVDTVRETVGTVKDVMAEIR